MVGYDSNVSHNFTTTDYQLAGASSGFFTRLLLQPLDVLKIRFQLQSEPISKASPFSKYHGIGQAVSCIYREEGFFGFWKGHNPAQGLSVIYGIVQFGCFEHLTASLYPHVPSRFTSGPLKPIYHFGCGGIAGCAAALVAHPFDVLRTRFVSQGEPKIYRSIYHAVQSMYKEAGVRTFYRGLIPALVQVFPHTSFQFAFYTLFNKMWESYFMSHSKRKDPPESRNMRKSLIGLSKPQADRRTVQSLTCGSLAGIAAKTIVYPLDLAKKRLEVQGFEDARRHFGRVESYKNLLDCLRTMYRKEGVLSFYKGLKPSILKAAFSTALTFTFYESALYLITEYRKV